MKSILKKSSAILLSLVLIISSAAVSGVLAPVGAATYVANWGQRGVNCTSLTSYANAYYTGNYSIEKLMSYAGGTSQSNAPNSALYNALKNMMTTKHTYINKYSANNTLLSYTDCINSNTNKISSFYSGTLFNSTWDSAKTWNKEHTWPNSKGLNGRDEDDVMMICPTIVSENSSRGNKAYGKSSGYYFPNSESGGKYDLRGDVARICLYQYTRWGNTKYMWGSSGVMESLDVLIEWMTEDPVDTWEMGRNDAVQSITGVRNVYVDYPELGFKLFGRSVPENYTSPSGKGSSVGNSGSGSTTPSVSAPSTTTSVTNTTTSTTTNDQDDNTGNAQGTGSIYNVLDQVVVNNGNTNTNTNDANVNINLNQNVIVDQSGNKIDTSKDYDLDINECRHEVTVHKNEIPATCESAGMTAELLCDGCGLYISPGKEIPKLTHSPSADGVTCEYCGKDFTKIEIDLGDDSSIDTQTLWLIIGGAVALLIVAGAIITIIVVKNKKKAKKAE